MLNSVRSRITLLYAAALAVTLSVFSLLVYNSLEKSMNDNIDQLLAYRAEAVSDALEAYLDTEIAENGVPADSSEDDGGAFLKMIQDLARLHSDDPRQAPVQLRIMAPSGEELVRYNRSAVPPELPDSTVNEVKKGNAVYDLLHIQDSGQNGANFRSYSTAAQGRGGSVYLVQAYCSTYRTQFALRHLRNMMSLLIPAAVLLTAIFGMFFARIALRPVSDMSRAVSQITAENLSLRIVPPKTNDEIHELACLFNGMLTRLEDSFMSEKRFIQDVSHELKTPLTILKGEVEVALKKSRSVGEYEDVLRSNLEETEKMSKIVSELLTLAHFDNREIKLQIEDVDLAVLVRSAAESMRFLADAKNISLKVFSSEDIHISGDTEKLARMFLNLIDNAIKYSPAGSEVSLEVAGGGRPYVSVTDRGCGIKPEDLPHVFRRFYRADSSRSSSGFGLGLAIVKSIADAHGAEVNVSSDGKGSVFTVFFQKNTH